MQFILAGCSNNYSKRKLDTPEVSAEEDRAATTDQSAGEAVRASGAGTGDLSSPSSSTCAAKPPSSRSPVLNSLFSTYDHLRKALDTEIDLSNDMLLCGNNLSDASTPGRNTGAQVRPDDEDGRASIPRAQSAPSQRVLTVSFTTGTPSDTPHEASRELPQRCESLPPAHDQQPDATGRPSNTPPEIRQGALRLAAEETSISEVRVIKKSPVLRPLPPSRRAASPAPSTSPSDISLGQVSCTPREAAQH